MERAGRLVDTASRRERFGEPAMRLGLQQDEVGRVGDRRGFLPETHRARWIAACDPRPRPHRSPGNLYLEVVGRGLARHLADEEIGFLEPTQVAKHACQIRADR
ncbi:MAG TPA: hypothetical protein VGZ51_05625, partial [Actinomycetota bacterium]|nr:hypothetical protein [Actinomycetota bacterium]